MAVVNNGVSKRQTYQTLMNENSSRSHSVITLTVVAEGKAGESAATGKLNFVDLAGCERLKRSGAGDALSGVGDTELRAKEAVIINKSLSTLGNVVIALANSEATFVPYRDSKLTRLLQDRCVRVFVIALAKTWTVFVVCASSDVTRLLQDRCVCAESKGLRTASLMFYKLLLESALKCPSKVLLESAPNCISKVLLESAPSCFLVLRTASRECSLTVSELILESASSCPWKVLLESALKCSSKVL